MAVFWLRKWSGLVLSLERDRCWNIISRGEPRRVVLCTRRRRRSVFRRRNRCKNIISPEVRRRIAACVRKRITGLQGGVSPICSRSG